MTVLPGNPTLPRLFGAVAALFLPIGYQAVGQDQRFASVGEGLAGSARHAGFQASYRMFTLPMMPKVCDGKRKSVVFISRLGSTLRLKVSQPFPLENLRIEARTNDGTKLSVPVAIETELADPPFFNVQAEAIADSRLHPIRAGETHVRIRSFCPGSTEQMIIPVLIAP